MFCIGKCPAHCKGILQEALCYLGSSPLPSPRFSVWKTGKGFPHSAGGFLDLTREKRDVCMSTAWQSALDLRWEASTDCERIPNQHRGDRHRDRNITPVCPHHSALVCFHLHSALNFQHAHFLGESCRMKAMWSSCFCNHRAGLSQSYHPSTPCLTSVIFPALLPFSLTPFSHLCCPPFTRTALTTSNVINYLASHISGLFYPRAADGTACHIQKDAVRLC